MRSWEERETKTIGTRAPKIGSDTREGNTQAYGRRSANGVPQKPATSTLRTAGKKFRGIRLVNMSIFTCILLSILSSYYFLRILIRDRDTRRAINL